MWVLSFANFEFTWSPKQGGRELKVISSSKQVTLQHGKVYDNGKSLKRVLKVVVEVVDLQVKRHHFNQKKSLADVKD